MPTKKSPCRTSTRHLVTTIRRVSWRLYTFGSGNSSVCDPVVNISVAERCSLAYWSKPTFIPEVHPSVSAYRSRYCGNQVTVLHGDSPALGLSATSAPTAETEFLPLPVHWNDNNWNCLFVSNQWAFNVSRVSGRSALMLTNCTPPYTLYFMRWLLCFCRSNWWRFNDFKFRGWLIIL